MAIPHSLNFCVIPPKSSSFLGPSFCSCRKLTVSCSAEKANRKVKPSRQTKSNEELCRDLLEFISAVGLPEQSLPSFKELCQHGRKDLAYRVRRRGYKLMQELLLNALVNDCTEVGNSERPPSVIMELANPGEPLPEIQDIGIGLSNNSSEDLDRGEEFVEGASSSFDTTVEECYSNQNASVHTNLNLYPYKTEDQPISLSLHEKAANFIQRGELDTLEGTLSVGNNHIMTALDLGFSVSSRNDDEGRGCSERKVDIDYQNSGLPSESSVLDREIKPKLNKGCVTSSEVTVDANPNRNLSLDDCQCVDFDKELAIEENEKDNLVELDHLKELLHQKELELFQLKKQIEKEKLALATLETKAKAEIGDAERIIAAKEAELLAAEESLCGLKEVRIDYQGIGEIVEVAGSFNGWHQRVKLDLQPSSETVQPTASRKPLLWSTVLWLYPGVYEIKFIVDGHWTIDPQREHTYGSHVQNNILRVDR